MATSVKLGEAFVDIRASLRSLDRDLARADAKIAGSLKRTGEKITSIGKTLTLAITAPLLALGAAATRAFASFDDAMTKSLAIMGSVSDALRKDMSEAARSVAKQSTFSADQAAEAYFFLASAGLDAASSVQALVPVSRFAQAGAFGLARATDLLTDAQSALGRTIRDDPVANMREMIKVSDILVKANTVANATVAQFSESLTNKAGAAMKQLNIDLETGVAVLAAWADQGVKGTEAGEKFNIVTRDLQTAIRKNADQFEKFNVRVFDSEGNLRNLADIVGDLEKALSSMSVEQQGTTLSLLGFQDRSVIAIRSLIGLSEQIREYEKDFRSAGSITKEVSDKQLRSFSAQMQLLKSRLNDVAITIGEVLAPVIARIGEKVGKAADAFADLSKEQQLVLIQLAGIIAAIGPALIGIGLLVKSFGVLISVVIGASRAVVRLLSLLALLPAAFFSIPTAIAAAVGGGVVLFSDTIIDTMDALPKAIGDVFISGFNNLVVNPFKKAINGLILILNNLPLLDFNLDFLEINNRGFSDDTREAFDAIAETAKREARELQESLSATFGGVLSGVEDILGGKDLTDVLLPEGVNSFISDASAAFDKLISNFKQSVDAAKAGAGEVADSASSASDTIDDELPDAAGKASDEIKDSFKAAGRSMTDSIGDAVVNGRNLLESLGNIARQVISEIVSALARAGLARAFAGTAFGGFFTAAQGGMPPVGRPAIVGEEGPEVIVPGRVSTVIPNDQLGGGGLSVSIGNINADDAVGVRRAVEEGVRAAVQISSHNTTQLLDRLNRPRFS